VDIDGNSVVVATGNVRRNQVAAWVRTRWSAGYRSRAVRAGEPYDLIMANILARPLALMARDLGAALAPGGTAVLAGLLARQAPAVLAAHRLRRLFLQRRVAIAGWHTLVLRRRPGILPEESTT
jgi:ribosomal protein L11 methyltransferase